MKPWTRDDTRFWIAQLENRIEDMHFYLSRTVEWCKANEIYSDRITFICSVMAVVWVSHLRNEPISKLEVFEILGLKECDEVEDGIFEFNPVYESLEFEELLDYVVSSFY